MLKIGDKCKVIKCHLRPAYIGQEVEIVNIHTMKNGTILYEIREKDNLNDENYDKMLDWLEKHKHIEKQTYWTKLDEKRVKEITCALQRIALEHDTYFYEAVMWLKSLKDRVQPKHDWCEEDEKIRKEIIYHIQHCDDTIDEQTEKRMLAWLEKQGRVKESQIYQHENKTSKENDNSLTNEEKYHLWTINDAKEGDILASNKSIFIFREEYIGGKPTAYCGLMNGLFIEGNGACWTNEKCYPATKEQRDLLFQKMKEAGYEWDAEKKELKKIEQKHSNLESIGEDWNEADEQEWKEIINKFTRMEWFDELNFLRHKLNR